MIASLRVKVQGRTTNRNCLPRECGVNLVATNLHRTCRERLESSGPKYKAAQRSSREVESLPQNPMMHLVHIGTPIRKHVRSKDNILLFIALVIVGGASAWFSLQDRTAGEFMTAAALAVGF